MHTIKQYYRLTKPGIIYGNMLTAAGGFFFASAGHVSFLPLFATLFGLALVVASGCVTNNYLDRGIDAKMNRTKHRAIVEGRISGTSAIIFATVLGLLGTAILLIITNPVATGAAVAGWVLYVVVYGYAKRRTEYGTIIGSLSGAIPPVVGTLAVTGAWDLGATLLFLILVLWQMPHFYAIAIRRQADYAAAGIPVLPVVRGVKVTQIHILVYIAAFALAAASLTVLGYTGFVYLGVMLVVSLWWFVLAARGFSSPDYKAWARRVFLFSLIVISTFCMMLSVDAIFP